eukprot:TRINITY_DN12122_c0_g1_i1.p1 TRINITY_DN12122_c0_g1~~TRINITY_DN12122_c0_g1_i1.p1  ORF type:complete len:351 (+),score=91.65 TRINITY_DN12122_c0_g1_i1:60-1055(+)
MKDDKSMLDLLKQARKEKTTCVNTLLELEDKLIDFLIPKDYNEDRDVIIEVRAGTGGEEAALFASDMYRMYERYAVMRGWKFSPLSMNRTELGGIKEAAATINSSNVLDGVYARMKYEIGVHRVQRIPTTEALGRIHTSTMTVAILPDEPEAQGVEVKDEDIRIDTYRSSGKGGQHVNKTDSAVRITHLPTGIIICIQDERSQHQNKTKALKLLTARLSRLQKQSIREEYNAGRKAQVGSAERSERIRTYNYPQSRITDHRIGLSRYDIGKMMDGKLLDDFIDALIQNDRMKQLQELGFKVDRDSSSSADNNDDGTKSRSSNSKYESDTAA